jgi:hypothetical protein
VKGRGEKKVPIALDFPLMTSNPRMRGPRACGARPLMRNVRRHEGDYIARKHRPH